MIKDIRLTSAFKSLKLEQTNGHAYLFYSADEVLNNNIALIYAKSLLCENHTACSNCNACKMFDSLSHPDLTIIEKDSIKVEDASSIINKLNTKPIISSKKLFIILNAENMNELAQNKLLKSLEEPNESNIFILTTTKTDKILPTVLSRVSKMFVPKLTKQDKQLIQEELLLQSIKIEKYVDVDISLTEILNNEINSEFQTTVDSIYKMLTSLKTSADIPVVSSSLSKANKNLFLSVLMEMFLSAIKSEKSKFDSNIILYIKNNYSEKAIIKCCKLIEDAYKKVLANVNFTYVLDNLLFNILKEKFLCK